MKHTLNPLLSIILFLAITPGWAAPAAAAPDQDLRVPALNIDNYRFPPEGNIEDRVYPAPQFILDYYAALDKDLIPADKPYKAYTPSPAEMDEVRAIIKQMPKQFTEKIAPRLLGVYFVENLIGSGWSEWMHGKDGKRYYIMLFNAKVLKMSASEWITGKEKSVFIMDDPSYGLQIDIGSGMSGFYYIFYHEISHVYDYIAEVTPGEESMETAVQFFLLSKSRSFKKQYPFMFNVWTGMKTPRPEFNFKGRENVTFYGLSGGPKIKISEAPEYYKRLRSTPFVTLYASLNWMEDFAEFMAAYMSVEVMKRPWTLKITKDGKVIYEMDDVFNRQLVNYRKRYAEKLVK